MRTKLLFLGGALSVLAALATFLSPSSPPLSPLASSSPTNVSNLESNRYIILGFVPYWNLKKIVPASLETITHLAYFNLHLNSDGSLYTKVNRREEDPGYTNYKRLLARTIDIGTKPLILTFMPNSQDALSSILTSSRTRKNTISTILALLQQSSASGVNIDFEPTGDIPLALRSSFTLFIQELSQQLTMNHQSLSISIYPSAAARPRLWNLAELGSFADYFVVMTYDYTMPASTLAGPNSPLRGAGTLFEHDIVKNISEISRLVPARKLLLGIPLYGYEWNTVDSSKYSPAESRGSVASLERIDKMLNDKTLELVWDRNSLTPYGVASTDGQVSQIYFENETSIRLKLDFVKSAGLGGIAIWALGYEGNNTWLWPTLHSLTKL